MLEFKGKLPAGALLDQPREGFRAALEGRGVIWLEGLKDRFETSETVITGWRDGAHLAAPSEPNEGNGTLDEQGGYHGLRCQGELNCGLALRQVTENASRFTMAVIYRHYETRKPRTLLTLNTGYAGGNSKQANYLFLADRGDGFTLKDTRGAVELEAPIYSDPMRPRMAIVTLSGNRLALAENLSAPRITEGADPGMRSAADLFIGCRSDRRGLKKTLGHSMIQEVMFWPDHTLLLPRSEADEAQYLALKRFFLWEF